MGTEADGGYPILSALCPMERKPAGGERGRHPGDAGLEAALLLTPQQTTPEPWRALLGLGHTHGGG